MKVVIVSRHGKVSTILKVVHTVLSSPICSESVWDLANTMRHSRIELLSR